MSDTNELPKFLDRKKNKLTPATADERAAFAAQAAPVVEAKPEPDPVVEQIEQDQARKKKAKQSNRIGRLAEKQSRRDIPDKYLGWDTKHCKFYDTRKGKPKSKKENVMTAKKKSNGNAKTKRTVVTRFKKSAAVPKASKTTKPAAKRSGSKREKLIGMLKRENGASLAEMLKANPLTGKTPLNTLAAMISVMSRSGDFKIERVGDGKGEHRRWRIV